MKAIISSVIFLLLICNIDALVPPEALVHTGVAALAGSCGAIAAYPIDYVKSQLQTEEGRAKYKNGIEATLDIVRSSPVGPFALYRGVWINILGIAPEKTIKLNMNDYARSLLTAHFGGHLPIIGEMMSGGFAGFCQVLITNPLEVVKVKVQTSNMTIKDVLAQVKSVNELYRGAEACIVRDVVFSSILFPLYAHVKPFLLTLLTSGVVAGDGGMSFLSGIVAGSISAAPAAFLATPPDVIKTRMQQARSQQIPLKDTPDSLINRQSSNLPPLVLSTANYRESKDPTFMETTMSIIDKEGPQVLFSGCLERMARSVPQFGVTLAVFDFLTKVAIDNGLLPMPI